jgi:osmotically-inducible protein OsmY
MSNEEIIDEIRATLERDRRIPHPAAVAVSEQEGTVSLRGTVASPQQRQAAVEIAKSVAGVQGVADELHVDPRDRFVDEEIRGRALQSLMSSPDVPADRVNVSVSDGWLTLKGEVRHQQESNAAFEAVHGLAGVGGITNEIRVITAGLDG